ncbi:MAG: signal peptidase I [Microbacterium sp.]
MMRKALFVSVRALVYAILIAVSVPFVWQLTTGGSSMVVTGTSMKPTYERGDVVFVQKATDLGPGFWQEGEIVAVAFSPSNPEENRYIHRVEQVLDDGQAVLKGDGNPEVDVSPVSLDQVIGVPVGALHGANAQIYIFTQQWSGRLLIFGLGILILVLIEMLAQRDKRRRALRTGRAGSLPEAEGNETAAEGQEC